MTAFSKEKEKELLADLKDYAAIWHARALTWTGKDSSSTLSAIKASQELLLSKWKLDSYDVNLLALTSSYSKFSWDDGLTQKVVREIVELTKEKQNIR